MNKPISLQNQLACAQRELAKRQRCYPKWIREGKLKQPVADYELKAQEAIVSTLEKLCSLEETTNWMLAKVKEKNET